MADLDQISSLLGALKEQNAEAQRQRQALFRKLEDVQKDVHEVGGVAKDSAKKVAHLEKRLNQEVLPHVEDYKKMKNRGLGVILGVSFVAGGVGASASRAATAIKDFLTGS